MIQLYGPDLQTVTLLKKEYTITITHRPTGCSVTGKGDHEYGLNAKLMQELREKVEAKLDEPK